MIMNINDSILFNHESNLLISKVTGAQVSLHSTASNCLALLIEEHGKTVTRETIFERVWHCYGLTVTNNAYYQTIRNLRKALLKTDVHCDIIKTVPRQGIMLPLSVSITALEANHSDIPTEIEQAEEQRSLPVPQSKEPGRHCWTILKKYYGSWWLPITGALMICGILTLAFLLQSSFAEKFKFRWRWSGYSYLGKQDQCLIYGNHQSLHLPLPEAILTDDEVSECSRLPYVYITEFEAVKRRSIIMCDKNIESKDVANCVSFYTIKR
ncbi:transcriptional regulator [Serratia fonticola]|jgi:DNA-binding winged helix-turn-helix (wHTH) protein|uniref:transcriptional regulator n=1 Tax=Serratia fonticola TaxID=47917 RepID=UPI0034C66EA0